MKERKANECGSKSQTRVNSGSRPRDNSLFSSFRKRGKRAVIKPNAPQAKFKWDDVEGDLAQALREAGL